jgi:hypothetical protein
MSTVKLIAAGRPDVVNQIGFLFNFGCFVHASDHQADAACSKDQRFTIVIAQIKIGSMTYVIEIIIARYVPCVSSPEKLSTKNNQTNNK